MDNSELETFLEKKATEFAYDKDKVLTFSERILMYQAYLQGAKFLLDSLDRVVKREN